MLLIDAHSIFCFSLFAGKMGEESVLLRFIGRTYPVFGEDLPRFWLGTERATGKLCNQQTAMFLNPGPQVVEMLSSWTTCVILMQVPSVAKA